MIRWWEGREIFFALLFLVVQGTTTYASEDMATLKERFRARYPALRAAKDAGKIGETAEGFVEAVPAAGTPEASTVQLLEEENRDRKTLYALIAEEERTNATLVAERNAKRNFENARPGDYLKGKDGVWFQKR